MIGWSLRAAAVILVGTLLVIGLRRRSAAIRSMVLRATLVAAWALPLLVLVAPRVALPLSRVPAFAPRTAPSIVGKPVVTPMPITQGWTVVQPKPDDVSTVGFVRQTPLQTLWVPAVSPLLAVWVLGTGLLVLRWVVAMGRLIRLARRSERPRRHEPSGDYGFADIAVPLTFGRVILLPREAKGWPEARVRAAVLHEQAHVRRGDWGWQVSAALFAALHWPNPAAWFLARLLRDAAEAAADDEALGEMAPSDYARELLAVAASARDVGPALAMARRGGLRDRVVAVLTTGRDRRLASWRVAVPVGLSIGIVAGALASVERQKTDLAPDSRGVYRLADGRTVEVVEMSGTDATSGRRWTPDGRSLGTYRKGNLPLTKPIRKGWRRVGIVLRQRGGVVRDAAVRVLDTPRLRFVSGLGYGLSDHKEIEQWITRFDVPAFEARADLTLLFATGPWKAWEGNAVVTKRTPFPFGVSGYRAMLTASLPPELSGRDVRLAAFDKQGQRITSGRPLMPPTGAGPVAFAMPTLGWGNASRMAFEYRDNESIRVPSVALRPLAIPGSPDREAVRSQGLAFVELISLSENGVAWRADGRLGGEASKINFDRSTRPGNRRVALHLRVRGKALDAPEMEISAANSFTKGTTTYTPADAITFGAGSKPNEIIGWASFQIGKPVRSTVLRVDFNSGPWTTHAVILPNGNTGQGTAEVKIINGRPVVQVRPHEITIPGSRRIELRGVDATGRFVMALRTSESQPSYSLPVEGGGKVAKWILRSRPLQSTSFDDVRLYPR